MDLNNLSVADNKAIQDVELAFYALSPNHSLNVVSFVYGFLLGRGCSDELATNVANHYNESY